MFGRPVRMRLSFLKGSSSGLEVGRISRRVDELCARSIATATPATIVHWQLSMNELAALELG
jgi:hypothetical protein